MGIISTLISKRYNRIIKLRRKDLCHLKKSLMLLRQLKLTVGVSIKKAIVGQHLLAYMFLGGKIYERLFTISIISRCLCNQSV